MGFDAGKAVATLEWDFTTIEGGQGKGVVPEPSRAEMDTFRERMRRAAIESGMAGVDEQSPPEEVADVLANTTAEKLQESADAMREALVDICNGSPSAEELDSIGGRAFQAFAGWLIGELGNPTAPDTKSSRAAAMNGASSTSSAGTSGSR